MLACPSCRAALSSGAAFCSGCGLRLTPRASSSPRVSPRVALGVGALALGVAGLVAVMTVVGVRELRSRASLQPDEPAPLPGRVEVSVEATPPSATRGTRPRPTRGRAIADRAAAPSVAPVAAPLAAAAAPAAAPAPPSPTPADPLVAPSPSPSVANPAPTSAPALAPAPAVAAAPTEPTAGGASAEAMPSDPDGVVPLGEEELAERGRGAAYSAGIRTAINMHRAQVRSCYERWFKDEAAPPGSRVEVTFTITQEGTAKGIQVTQNTSGREELGGCLKQRVAEWRFPRPPSGEFRATFPFIFSAGVR